MDIPENLQKFLTLEHAEKHLDLVGCLVTPESKGTLICIAALAEEEIAVLLIRYFALPARVGEFKTLIASNLNFNEKIGALAKILPKLDATEANYQPHLRFLRALQKLRNTAAHSYSIHIDKATELAADTEVAHITAEYPKNLWKRFTALQNYLSTLNAG